MEYFLNMHSTDNAIARSWQRSRAYGLEQSYQADPCVISKSDLADHHEQHHLLLHHLKQILPLFQQLQGEKSCRLLFANTEGTILFSTGAACFNNKAQKIALALGARWHEQNMGTNAIGTALSEQQDISVLGQQHFITHNHQISCSASPVFAPDGSLLGVIDISSEASAHSQDMLFSARLVAQSLENALLTEQQDTHWLLNLANHSSYIQLPWSGLVALGEDGQVLGANRIARHWLDTLNMPELFARLRQGELTPIGQGIALLSRKVIKPIKSSSVESIPNTDELLGDNKKALTLLNAGIPLLIRGETGVGKDHLVRNLHKHSECSHAPLIAVNCGALPAELIEAELFGYQPGAFTGSNKQGRLGYIRAADKGILFLDEIGELPLSAQTRLLRVLQEKAVVPLGCHEPQQVDFKVIAASHKNLKEMVEQGLFRQDLFFRLSGYQLTLPALREYSHQDFEQLVNTLLQQLRPEQTVRLQPCLLQYLAEYAWPGNIRQLKQALEVALVLADGVELQLEHFPALPEISTCTNEQCVDLQANKKKQIKQVLSDCAGNVSAAARKLGISRTTLYAQLKKPD